MQQQQARMLVGALATILVLLAIAPEQARARYLPTRADSSDVETLKEILRKLYEPEIRQRAMRMSDLQEMGYLRPSGQLQLESRSMENPVSSNGDGPLRGIQSPNDYAGPLKFGG